MDISRDEAQGSTQKAIDLLRDRMSVNSSYGVYQHAQDQLERMLELLRADQLPGQAARGFVDIGLMAAKELEASDEELANALMDADYDFKHAQ